MSTRSAGLQATEDASAAVATHPRVTLASIEAKIARVYYVDGEVIASHGLRIEPDPPSTVKNLWSITVCMIVMRNGFMLLGKSAPASHENFNAELGRNLAYEDAVRQVWQLEGYVLREALYNEKG